MSPLNIQHVIMISAEIEENCGGDHLGSDPCPGKVWSRPELGNKDSLPPEILDLRSESCLKSAGKT